MIMKIKALTFDTGGTILDWHSGICSAFQHIGERHGISLDWHTVTNDYRRLAMTAIVGQVQPAFNMDDVHRTALDTALSKHGLQAFTAQEIGRAPSDLQSLMRTPYAVPCSQNPPPTHHTSHLQ